MKVYMILTSRKDLSISNDDFREMIRVSLNEIRKSFPDADLLNDETNYHLIDDDTTKMHRCEYHFELNITERDINKVKLTSIKDANRLFNKDTFVDTLLIADGENSSFSSYYIRLKIKQ